MQRLSIALIYDDSLRPDTTGVYCLRALQPLAEVTHFRPDTIPDISTQLDLHLRIDDGLDYHLPSGLGPSAFWAIDTHLNFPSVLQRAQRPRDVIHRSLTGRDAA